MCTVNAMILNKISKHIQLREGYRLQKVHSEICNCTNNDHNSPHDEGKYLLIGTFSLRAFPTVVLEM